MEQAGKRTTEQLLCAAEHLLYEVRMFDLTARQLTSGGFGDGVVRNALLESFAIHTRTLRQVFFPQNPGADEILAAHYFDNPSAWAKPRGKLPEALSNVKDRVGKEIVHLTYDRLDVGPEAKGWKIQEIWKAMTSVIDVFVQHAPKRYLGSWFQSAATDAPAISAITTTAA